MDVTALTPGTVRYASMMAQLAADPLAAEWWQDAESGVDAGVSYMMVTVAGRPAAWAGWQLIEGGTIVKCCNNYVRRGHRNQDPELYKVAFLARHDQVLTRLGLPAVTYLFPEPIPLHLEYGWRLDTGPGSAGTSRAVRGGPLHHWRRLVWTPVT